MDKRSVRYVSDRMVSFNRIKVRQNSVNVIVDFCDDHIVLTTTKIDGGLENGEQLTVDFHEGFVRLEVK